MDLPIKSTKKTNGFTLIEIVLVLGILALFIAISTSVYNGFKTHENIEITTSGVVEAIRHAQLNSEIGKGDSSWGVKILSNSVLIFKGTNYSLRDTSADQLFNFPGGVVASGLSEIVFAKITGATANIGTVTLTNSYGVKNILINAKGTLTY